MDCFSEDHIRLMTVRLCFSFYGFVAVLLLLLCCVYFIYTQPTMRYFQQLDIFLLEYAKTQIKHPSTINEEATYHIIIVKNNYFTNTLLALHVD